MSGTRRTLVAGGALLCIGAAFTAAATVDSTRVRSIISPTTGNVFDIAVAGSDDDSWKPLESDWMQGNPDAYAVGASGQKGPLSLGPGASRSYSVAVKNVSPELASSVSVAIFDPDPISETRRDQLGRYKELFGQMRFSLTEGRRVLIDDVPGSSVDRLRYKWGEPLLPGSHREMKLTIRLPNTVGNEYQEAASGVQLRFSGDSL